MRAINTIPVFKIVKLRLPSLFSSLIFYMSNRINYLFLAHCFLTQKNPGRVLILFMPLCTASV